MIRLLKPLWRRLRFLLSRVVGEGRLERFLFRVGIYKLKSRLLLERGFFPPGVELLYREPDKRAIDEVCVKEGYGIASIDRGDVVIDVGANIGAYTVQASKKVGDGGLVLSFEPEPENLRILEKNIAINNCFNVRIFPYALSDTEGKTELFLREAPGSHSILGGSEAVVSVPARRLDSVIGESSIDRVKVLKIDVEGLSTRCFWELGRRCL
jgi:FkbM family methyltransferase